QILVKQNNSSNVTDVVVSVRFASTSSNDAIAVSDTSTQRSGHSAYNTWGWNGYPNTPPQYIYAQVEITLPQIPRTSFVSIFTDNYDILLFPNSIPFSNQILATTANGNINLSYFASSSVSLQTSNGNIRGSLYSVRQRLWAGSNNGNINLNTVIDSTANGVVVYAQSSNGNINLRFVNFRGQFDVSTNNGDITISNARESNGGGNNRKFGNVGDGNYTLTAISNNGDMNVIF
ncbi:2695_t:CDS:2, partial [Acaulospora colombiana]